MRSSHYCCLSFFAPYHQKIKSLPNSKLLRLFMITLIEIATEWSD